MSRSMLRLAATVFALSVAPALAGPFDQTLLPPANVGGQDGVVLAQSDGTIGDLMARIQRLEGQNRQLTGQVQEMQNQLRRAQDDFNRYREDTEFRLQQMEGGGKSPPVKPQKKVDAAPPVQRQATLAPPPQSLGTLPADPGQPVPDDGQPGPALDDQQTLNDPNVPMALPGGGNPAGGQPRSSLTPPGLPGVAVNTAVPPPVSPQAATVPRTPEDEYSADYRLIESGSYEAAEQAFRKFLASYPKDKRVPDAIHWVGESLFQRKQYRDAAEQFLDVTKNYSGYRRAPSSMYRLGMSLAALGEKEAACATFQEIGRKYPNAAATVKSGVERETQRNGC